MLECQKRNHIVPAMYCVGSSTSFEDGTASPAVVFWNFPPACLVLAIASLGLHSPAYAEGSVHAGLNQPFVETNATAPGAASSRDLIVDIRTVGEVINISGCATADNVALSYVIERPNGTIEATFTTGTTATSVGKVACANTMAAPLTTPYRYTTTMTGKYKVRLIVPGASTNFNRFDVTVTANSTINPDPTGATGITGRVSSLSWQYSTGAYSQASSTDANYYVLTPGGSATDNYVWQLDLNDMAGNGYGISANNKGVNAPRSGYSTDVTGNTVVPQFPVYLQYPAVANPPPSTAPAVTGFRFIDSAGQDFGISPGVTVGAQDTGTFEFTTNVSNATYAIAIDVNKNGIFGDAGDVTLSGNAINGFNSIAWNGTNNSGVVLPLGSYQARAEVRLGEFHFIANDVETSGGTSNGLTVYEATSPSTVASTQVYWDDITILGAAAGGTSNTPLGATSGTSAGYHTWGTFDAGGGGFGNNRFVDTYAFGRKTQASLFVAIVGSDAPMTGANGVVTITPSSRPSDALTLSVTDADLNSLSTIVETILVSVVNSTTGESETVTLTETGVNTGIFTGTLPTSFGTAAGANNDGTLLTQAANSLTVTYNDALTSTGGTAVRSATGTVIGGTTGTLSITPTSAPGDTLAISVNDADLNSNALTIQTITVSVVNATTGESENVTLTETGPNTGVFSGSLATAAGAAAGTNNNGSMNSAAGNLITVTYSDAVAANGGPASVTATDTVTSFNPIVAANDSVSGIINGAGGTANAVNVFGNDLINGVAAGNSNAVLSVASGSTVPAQLTFNVATGSISVNAGATAATYSFNYQICESINLANCRTATASVTVVAPIAPIVLTPDSATGINGAVGAANVVNVFSGDTINGIAATSTNAILTVATGFTVPAGLAFDTATGNVSVTAGTAAGTYSFNYQLCEAANPSNCKTAGVTVTVAMTSIPVVATNDNASGVNGFAGAANVVNAFTGDTVNAVAANAANAILSVASGSTVPAGLAFNTTTGNVSVTAGTAAGSYSFNYQICAAADTASCATASITVVVDPTSDLTVRKTNSPGLNGEIDLPNDTVMTGSSVTYSIIVTNQGPDAANGANVKDTPISGLTCPASSPVTISGNGTPSGSFTIADLTGAGITLGSLSNGQSATLSFSCQVN